MIDMGGVLELYPINGKTTAAETLTKKDLTLSSTLFKMKGSLVASFVA